MPTNYALPNHQQFGNQLNFTAWLNNLRNNNIGVLTNAGAPTSGTSGTFVNKAGPGCLLIDITNKIIYLNTNTKASPTWTAFASASGLTLVSPTLTTPTINSPVISSLKSNFSTATVAAGYAVDTYLAGSNIAIPTGGFVAGATYNCTFDMVKTAAGTATLVVVLRIGTLGTVGDAAILTFTFAAGTAAADSGIFTVTAHFRSVGSGTSALLVGLIECSHALATTGLISTGASGFGQLSVVSGGFDSTIANTIVGLSVNGGASFSGTNSVVEATLRSY